MTAKRPYQVWHVDLTVVPTSAGLWTAWIPFALPQCWAFCWWVAIALDHFSRCVTGIAVFRHCPTSMGVHSFLERAMDNVGAIPKYIISDMGKQFWCDAFKGWCRRHHIKPRYGAVGQRGSIAVVERFMLTLKTECTSFMLVPLTQARFQAELSTFAIWYHQHRPHPGLAGRTPDELYHDRFPSCLRSPD